MARSPLLRALQALAREHQEASALGLDVEELRKGRSEGRLSRRELIKRSGIVGAAVALGGPAAVARAAGSPLRAPTAPRIAIVGGGIAGLTAALTLQDKGVAADVYESSSRVGGRMHSDWQEVRFANFWARPAGGALWRVDRLNHKTILQLAQRFGLPTVDLLQAQPNGTEDTYWIFGADYPFAQASADFKPVHNTLQGQVQSTSYPTLYNSFTPAGQFFDQMTLYDWIKNYVPGGQARNWARYSMPPTTRSTAPRRPTNRRSTSSTCSATRPGPAPGRSTARPTSGTTSSAATRSCRSRWPVRSRDP